MLFFWISWTYSTYGAHCVLFVELHENVGESVHSLLEEESDKGVDKIDYYLNFANQAHEIKDKLVMLLHDLKQEGNTIIAYGLLLKLQHFLVIVE